MAEHYLCEAATKHDESDNTSESSAALTSASHIIRRPVQQGDVQSLTDESALNDLPSDGELFMPIINKKETQKPKQKQIRCIIFDMRTSHRSTGHFLYLSLIEQTFKTSKSFIHNIGVQLNGAQVIVISKDLSEQYLLIEFLAEYYCLVWRRSNTSVSFLEQELKSIIHVESVGIRQTMDSDCGSFLTVFDFPVEKQRLENFKSKQYLRKTFQVFLKEKRIDLANLLKLPNFSVVRLAAGTPVLWRIYCRYILHCDKRYTVKCNSVNTLTQIKLKFLEALSSEQTIDPFESNDEMVWFTQHLNLIRDADLRDLFDKLVERCRTCEELVMESQMLSTNLQLSQNSEFPGLVCIDDVYVHFQTKDAIPMQIVYRNDEDSSSNTTALVVLPPHIDSGDLRQEISKVVRQEATSLRITVGTMKLRGSIDLKKESNSKILVAPKKAIVITIAVASVPLSDANKYEFNFSVYSYDTLKSLKKHVCTKADVDQCYKVDIIFDGRVLDVNKTFSECRIKDRDRLEATIYIKRLLIAVRMPNRRLYDLLVDDSTFFTVGHIKAFARTIDGVESVNNFEIAAIANDRFVSDTVVLSAIKSDTAPELKILLVKTDSVCFTEETKYNGTLAVLQPCPEDNSFRYVLAMCNGKRLFCADILSQEEVMLMLEMRRNTLSAPATIPGIRIVPHYEDFAGSIPHRRKFTSAFSSPTPSVWSLSTSRPYESSSPIEDIMIAGILGKRTHQTPGHSLSKQCDLDVDDAVSPDEGPTSKRKRDESDSFKLQDDNLSEQTPMHRCESCPPESRQPAALINRSASESALLCHTASYNKTLRREADGCITVEHDIKVKTRATPEHLQQNPGSVTFTIDQSAAVGGFVPFQQFADQASQNQHMVMAYADPTYVHVRKCIIEYIAFHLGADGNRVIRALELSESDIDSADTRHPKNLYEKYFYLLRCWLAKEGPKASTEKLKTILKEAQRCDLAVGIEEMESGSTETTSIQQKADVGCG